MWVLSSHIFHFEVVSFLLDRIWSLLAMALIVIFHPELRRAFAQLGTAPFFYRNRKKEAIAEVATAILNMSRRKCGALIVFERENGLRQIVDDAVKLDIKLNSLVIESIFYPNSPLHDGAIIIRNDRIVAAHAILPLSRDISLPREIGTRHRAALGISEEYDAVTVVVSEETGKISITHDGVMHKNLGPEKLIRLLNDFLVERKPRGIISENENDDDIMYENNSSEGVN
jgi:diadenylate cyclase